MFSSIDLTTNLNKRPVARQLRHSVLEYMTSNTFNPSNTITVEDLKSLKLEVKQAGFSAKDIYE